MTGGPQGPVLLEAVLDQFSQYWAGFAKMHPGAVAERAARDVQLIAGLAKGMDAMAQAYAAAYHALLAAQKESDEHPQLADG